MAKIPNFLKSRHAQTSAFYYFGNFAISFGNYIFHLVLIRLLAPAYYGEFLAYISFLYLLAIPSGSISVLVTKHIADYYGKNDKVSINHYFYFIISKIIGPTIILGSIVIAFSFSLSHLFKADPIAFVVLGISIITSLIGSVLRSYITAFQQFIFVTLLGLGEIVVKILIAVILIKLGLNATGAVVALLLSGIATLLIIFLKIKPSILPKLPGQTLTNVKISTNLFYSFIYSAGTLSLMSADVLLVRVYFDTHSSGLYSALSMLGRMIYFGVAPLSGLLLPIVGNRYAMKSTTKTIFKKLGLVGLTLGAFGTLVFSLKPETVVSALSGRNYMEISHLLPLFSITMLMFALSFFLLTYLIAIDRQKVNYVLLIATVSQPLIIYFKHNNISEIVTINFIIQLSLLVALLIYYKMRTNNIS